MTPKEESEYLKLHEITICKYAARGKIPASQISKFWRFDKDHIDRWIGGVQKQIHTNDYNMRGSAQRGSGKKRLGKRKGK